MHQKFSVCVRGCGSWEQPGSVVQVRRVFQQPCCSYPAQEEKVELKQGPVFSAEHWGAAGLSKKACDAPQIPHCGLATGWKGWLCFHSHPAGCKVWPHLWSAVL